MAKAVVLIIAATNFQPKEYSDTRAALERAGIAVEVASDVAGSAIATDGTSVPVKLTVDKIPVQKYDALVLIGGGGALEHLNNTVTMGKMREAYDAGKVIGAICVSPRILARAGLLKDKKATGWDGDHELKGIFKKYDVLLAHIGEHAVIDGRIVTGQGPAAAQEFGEALVQVLK